MNQANKISLVRVKVYDFYEICIDVYSRVTLVLGNSGTGKTFVYKLLKQYYSSMNNLDFLFLDVFNKASLEVIYQVKDKIIVIDNADVILTKSLKNYIQQDTNNYYILFGRNTKGLGIGHEGVAKLKFEKNFISLRHFMLEKRVR